MNLFKSGLKDHSNKAKVLLFFLIIINLLFLVYYSYLSYYNRLHYDDYNFLWLVRDKSVAEFASHVYIYLSGRFVAYTYIYIYTKFMLLTSNYFILPIINWLIGVALLSSIFISFFKNLSKFLIINISCLLFNVFVLTNIDFPIVFWLCAMSYLLIPVLFLYLLKLIYGESSIANKLLIVFFSVFVGGGLEIFTPVALTLLFCLGLYQLKVSGNSFIHEFKTNKLVQNIILSGLVMFFSFLIVVAAPGNYVRMNDTEFMTGQVHSSFFVLLLKSIAMFYYQLSFYLPYYSVLILLFAFLGLNIKSTTFNLSYLKLLLYSIAVYLIVLLLTVIPNVLLTHGFGIQRTYTQLVFFTILFLSFNALIFGCFFIKNIFSNYVYGSLIAGLFVLCLVMVNNLRIDIPTAKKYAESADARVEYLCKLNKVGNEKLITLKPLFVPYTIDAKYSILKAVGRENNPKPVLYYTSEISSDSAASINSQIQKFLKLRYNIRSSYE